MRERERERERPTEKTIIGVPRIYIVVCATKKKAKKIPELELL